MSRDNRFKDVPSNGRIVWVHLSKAFGLRLQYSWLNPKTSVTPNKVLGILKDCSDPYRLVVVIPSVPTGYTGWIIDSDVIELIPKSQEDDYKAQLALEYL